MFIENSLSVYLTASKDHNQHQKEWFIFMWCSILLLFKVFKIICFAILCCKLNHWRNSISFSISHFRRACPSERKFHFIINLAWTNYRCASNVLVSLPPGFLVFLSFANRCSAITLLCVSVLWLQWPWHCVCSKF